MFSWQILNKSCQSRTSFSHTLEFCKVNLQFRKTRLAAANLFDLKGNFVIEKRITCKNTDFFLYFPGPGYGNELEQSYVSMR